MVEIYCDSDITFTDVALSYEAIHDIMTTDIVKPDDFVEIRFSDGKRCAVRKKNIYGFSEYEESE